MNKWKMGQNRNNLKRVVKSDRRSLWSVGARDRFGSLLRILQTPGTRGVVGFLSIIARVSKWTTKAVPSARTPKAGDIPCKSEEHTSELQSLRHLVCRLLLEKKKTKELTQCDRLRDLGEEIDAIVGEEGERREVG